VERHRGLAPRRLALEPRAAPRLARRYQSARWPNRARLRGGAAARPLGRRRAGGASERQAPGLVTLTTPQGEPPRATSSPRPSAGLAGRASVKSCSRSSGVHCRQIGTLAPVDCCTASGRYWHKADIWKGLPFYPFRGEADVHEDGVRLVRLENIHPLLKKKSTDSPTSQSYSRSGAIIRAESRLCSVHSIPAYWLSAPVRSG